jgi:uncharacterized repeat protein (TIGR01451 family)
MPPADLPTPDPSGSPATSPGLPDWLTATVPGADSPLLAGIPLPELPADPSDLADELPTTGAEKSDNPAPVLPATAGSERSPDPTETPPPAQTLPPRGRRGEWQMVRFEVPHTPTGSSDDLLYKFTVKAPPGTQAHDCRVEFQLPRNVPRVQATRSSRRTTNGLEWDLGTLQPGASVNLAVRFPLSAEAAPLVGAPRVARIAFRPVPVPLLVVSCAPPTFTPAGQPRLQVAVTNCGTAPSGEVRIVTFAAGSARVVAEVAVPQVGDGETQTVALLLPVSQPGQSLWVVKAMAAHCPPAQTTVEFATPVAELSVDIAAEDQVETDDETTCEVSVTNRGPVTASGVLATLSVPEELLFRSADGGGSLSLNGERVEWLVGDLLPNGSWRGAARLAGFAPGRLRLVAIGNAIGAAEVTTEKALTCEVRRSTAGASLAELLAGLSTGAFGEDTNEPVQPRRDVGERHLILRAAASTFALPIRNVREVLRRLPLTPLPGVPGWVAGVANIRGDVVTVIDFAGFLRLTEAGTRDRLVIVHTDSGDNPLGFLVDDVVGIRALGADTPMTPDDEHLVRFLAGITIDQSGVIHRLAPAELLAAAEADVTVSA